MLRVILFFIYITYVISIGEYIPQYKDGSLLPKQCWGSTGTCWCIHGDKTPFKSTIDHICPDSPLRR
jgi:hypothetical protein